MRALRLVYKFCQITPEIYPQLKENFSKSPRMETLGKYYKSSNLPEIYNIVLSCPMQSLEKLKLFERIEKELCNECTDLEFNVLANVYKQKSFIHLQTGNLQESILQIERALKSIQAMEDPLTVELANIYQLAGLLHMRVGNYDKALKLYRDAEHMVKIAEEEVNELENVPEDIRAKQKKQLKKILAKVFSETFLCCMEKRDLYEARKALSKALPLWEGENQYGKTYFLTIKFKCYLHLWSGEKDEAILTATSFLENIKENQETFVDRLFFMKFLLDLGVETYSEELKANIENLSKVLDERELTNLLQNIGVLKQNDNSKNKNDKK